MHPAATQAFGMRRVEQVAHHEGTVFLPGVHRAISQDHKHHRGSEEGIEVIAADDDGVETAQCVAHHAVGHSQDDGTLAVLARGGVHARLDDLLNYLF